jgi:hypothetical protein
MNVYGNATVEMNFKLRISMLQTKSTLDTVVDFKLKGRTVAVCKWKCNRKQ